MRKTLILAALAAIAPATASMAQDNTPRPAAPPAKPAQKALPPKVQAQKPDSTAAGHTVGEVVVTGQAPALQTSIDRRSYDVGKDLQAQTGSISDALRNVPSVEVDVQGNVSLRGDPNVTILIDGKPSGLFQGDNKGQALQSLPASQIDRVEVITNPSAEFRADGTGGIINLITKKAKGAGPTGSIRAVIGTRARGNASVTGGYNSGKLSLAGDLSFRHDEQHQVSLDDRFKPDPTGGFDETRQTSDQQLPIYITQARGSLDYDATERTRFGLETHGSYVDFHLFGPSGFTQTNQGGLASSFNRDLDIQQWRGQGEVSASLRHKFDDKGQLLTASVGYEVINDDRIRAGHNDPILPPGPDSFDRQRLNYDMRHTELKADYVKPVGDKATLKAGIDLEAFDNSYGNLGSVGAAANALVPDPTTSNLFLFKQKLSQGYVIYEQTIGDFSALAGLRVEDTRIDLDQRTRGQTDQNNYTKLFPSLHLGWKLDDEQKLSASYSHRIQRPDPLQYNTFLFPLDPLNFRSGNARLKPSEMHSYEVGYEYRAAPKVYLATLYYRDSFNGFFDTVVPLGNGQFVTLATNITRSHYAGLELVASGRLWSKAWTYNVSSNLYWNQIEPQPPPFGSPDRREAFGGSARGSVTWQATPKDLVQFNGFWNGKRLTTQGFLDPFGALNIGYKRKVTDQLSLLVQANDVLHTIRFRQTIDTPNLKARIGSDIDSRQFYVGFVWTLGGGGRGRDPGFDFGGGGGAPPQ